MFVGGKMVDEDQTKMALEARLVESENMIRHYETVVRNRDQELNITKRVSRAAVLRFDVAWGCLSILSSCSRFLNDRAATFHTHLFRFSLKSFYNITLLFILT